MKVRVSWVLLLCAAALTLSAPAQALEKQKLILDWFPNADHVPLYAARDLEIFKKYGLDIEFVPPADPNDPLKLVAAGQAAFAVSYEPSVITARSQGLPIKAIGVLIDRPLSCMLYLKKSGIRTAADLKGRRIGYSVESIDLPLMHAVAAYAGLKPIDYTPVNIKFNLTSSLLTGQVDAVMGAFWNYELLEVEREKQPGAYLALEQHGVPTYSEMVLISSDAFLKSNWDSARRFVLAVQEGINFARSNPKAAFDLFSKSNPEAKEDLDREAFRISVPLFANTQVQSKEQWARWAKFAKDHSLISTAVGVEDLIANVAAKP
jgi:putative hydroxymethylpyrimidine transport system substrate-binding protein